MADVNQNMPVAWISKKRLAGLGKPGQQLPVGLYTEDKSEHFECVPLYLGSPPCALSSTPAPVTHVAPSQERKASDAIYSSLKEILEILEREAPGTKLNNRQFTSVGIAAHHAVRAYESTVGQKSVTPPPAEHVVGVDDRCSTYEDILRVVCGHLELPQSESGPADDVRLYDRALEAMDVYSKKADADLAENTRLRFKAEAQVFQLRKALAEIGDGFVAAKDAPSAHDEAVKIARSALSASEVEG